MTHSLWGVERWPTCAYHVFLSHCREDKRRLVRPLFRELSKQGLSVWFDESNYPVGSPSFAALREAILRTRHVVYLITPTALKQGRGWMQLERGYGERLQGFFCRGGEELAHVELPLVFAPRNSVDLRKSIWSPLIDRAAFCPERSPSKSATWAVEQVLRFIGQEEQRGLEQWDEVAESADLNERFGRESTLVDRLRCVTPPRLSPSHG
jgi:hypothetical protein